MKNIITFMLGAAVGSLITWKLVEKKYKQIADEEIESVREYYRGKKEDFYAPENIETEEIEFPKIPSEERKENLMERVQDLGYDFSEDDGVLITEDEDGSIWLEPEEKVEPYVISPDEYGEIPGYDAESWSYYADGVLTNDDDEIVDDIEKYIGDALNHFGEFEDDCVHVRNQNVGIKCDIEIIKYSETYDEIHGGESDVHRVRA